MSLTSPTSISSITQSSNDDIKREKYQQELEDYYINKGKYEQKLFNFKNNKKYKNLDFNQKKEALANFKKKIPCIYCKKPGGTNFFKKDGHLIATCGSTDSPCNLNIDIKTHSVTNIVDTIEHATKTINDYKKKITQLKLDLLFEMDNEEVILNEFQTYKEQLEQILSFIVEFKEYSDNNNYKVAVVNEETGEKTYISKQKIIGDKQLELNNLISKFKKNIKIFKETNENSIINDNLQLYKNVIVPLQNEIRNLKYQEIFIEKIKNGSGKITKKSMPTYHFIPCQISNENKVISGDDFEIVQNIKK